MAYLAILVAAIAAHVLGFLWYGPLFGKTWMKLMNVTEKDKGKAKHEGMTKVMVGSFLTTLVMAVVLDFLISEVGYVDVTGTSPFLWNALGGALTGAIAWLGFLATTQMGMVFWENKPWSLYALNTIHYLVTLVVMGAIIGAWP